MTSASELRVRILTLAVLVEDTPPEELAALVSQLEADAGDPQTIGRELLAALAAALRRAHPWTAPVLALPEGL